MRKNGLFDEMGAGIVVAGLVCAVAVATVLAMENGKETGFAPFTSVESGHALFDIAPLFGANGQVRVNQLPTIN